MSGRRDDPFFQVDCDLNDLASIFECVNQHAQTMLADATPETEHAALILECIAEKGIREAAAALDRLHTARKGSAKVSQGLLGESKAGGETVQ
jgi:hypothetical protein